MKCRYFPLLIGLLFTSCGNNFNNREIKPTSISLSEELKTLYVNDSFQLTVSFLPENVTDKGVIWNSSDPEILEVDEKGLVTAINSGNAFVTATYKLDETINTNCDFVILNEVDIDDSDIEFTVKKIDALTYSQDNVKQIDLYFRKDRLKTLPYIDITTYYSLLLNKELTVNKEDEHYFKLISANEGISYIDTKNNILTSDDYEKFISTTIYRQEGAYNTYFDGAPFLKLKETVFNSEVKKTTIDFKKYGINIIEKEDHIYLPFVTASNMFSGPTMIQAHYYPEKIVVVDPNDPNFGTEALTKQSDYFSGVNQNFKNGKREEDIALFSYGEMCFLVDTYYGLPGRERIHDNLSKYGLDIALNKESEFTRIAKEWLLSGEEIKYHAGLSIISDYLSDAGHTVFDMGAQSLYEEDYNLFTEINNLLKSIDYHSEEIIARRNWNYLYYSNIKSASSRAGIKNNSYSTKGDTALFTFNVFDYNQKEWESYYTSGGELPSDVFGSFIKMLNSLNKEEIKNVAINISINGGGYADVVFALIGIMTGKSYFHYYDHIAKAYLTTYYEVDRNVDGKFDDKDNEVKYDFNFAIITSAISFSCGNILPSLAKDNGIFILGDKSGGGSCAVIEGSNTEGLLTRYSCQIHIFNDKNEEIEYGVPVHVSLVSSENPSINEFSKFYDLDLISEKMNEFYLGGN